MSDQEPSTGNTGDAWEFRLDAALAHGFGALDRETIDAGSISDRKLGRLGSSPWIDLGNEIDTADLRPLAAGVRELLESTGRYEVYGEIGRGGMGLVVSARDLKLGREVAIKLLDQGVGKSARRVHQFVEEGQIASQLQHPGIVPIYDIGLVGDERPYFSMKRLSGRSFEVYLQEAAEDETAATKKLLILEKAAEAMAYAHARGVIHRDLKPSNLMVGDFGEVVVVDWGLAKVLKNGDEGIGDEGEFKKVATLRELSEGLTSMAGSVAGTPAYMAPEQARGEVQSIDARSDVYALGAMLFRILAGRLPIEGDSGDEIRQLAARGELLEAERVLQKLEGEFDRELVQLARASLSAEPSDRPRDAAAFRRRLQHWRESLEERAENEHLARVKAEAKAVEERRARRLALGLALVVLAIIVTAATYFINRERTQSTQRLKIAQLSDAAGNFAEAARKEGPGDPADNWVLASERAERALALANAAELPTAEIEKWTTLASIYRLELEARRGEVAQKRRDQKMVGELSDIWRQRAFNPIYVKFEQDYARIFRDHGIDFQKLTRDDIREFVSQSAIRIELIEGFHAWALTRRLVKRFGDQAWRDMLQFALDVDDDRVRSDALREVLVGDQPVSTLLTPRIAKSLGATIFDLLAIHVSKKEGVDEAITVYEEALRWHPDDVFMHLGLAGQLERTKPRQMKRALRQLEIAAALMPNNAQLLTYWARLNRSLGNQAAAGSLVRKALALNQETWRLWLEKGYVELANNDLEASEKSFREASQLGYAQFEPHFGLGALFQKRGLHEKAVAAFLRAAKLSLKPQLSLFFAALSEERRGRKDEAEVLLSRIVENDPKNVRALSRLGRLLASRGRPKEAEVLIDRTLEVEPQNPSANYYKGTGYLQKRRYRKAEPFLRRAARASSSSAEIQLNYGLCLQGLRRYEEAIDFLHQGLDLTAPQSQLQKTAQGWLATAESNLATEEKMAASLAGRFFPADHNEWIQLAEHAYRTRDYLAAARLWQRAFESGEVVFETKPQALVRAAISALVATEGLSVVFYHWKEGAQASWQQQADRWLLQHLASLKAAHKRGDLSAEQLQNQGKAWLLSKHIQGRLDANASLKALHSEILTSKP
ncbi:MAG: protein kinase [Planctomycetota bacterium]